MNTTLENPLDTLFNIDGSDREVAEYVNAEVSTAVSVVEKDDEDVENDGKLDKVYGYAVNTFQNQMAMVDIIEPRYAARNAEVAAAYLNIALQAVSAKAKIKLERKKSGAVVNNTKITNNNIVATREEIMKMIKIDADTKEIK